MTVRIHNIFSRFNEVKYHIDSKSTTNISNGSTGNMFTTKKLRRYLLYEDRRLINYVRIHFSKKILESVF